MEKLSACIPDQYPCTLTERKTHADSDKGLGSEPILDVVLGQYVLWLIITRSRRVEVGVAYPQQGRISFFCA
jgi:hypothetical protein